MVSEEVGEWFEIALKKFWIGKKCTEEVQNLAQLDLPRFGGLVARDFEPCRGRSDVDQDAAEEDDLAEHVQIREVDLVGVELLAVVGADQDAAAGPV